MSLFRKLFLIFTSLFTVLPHGAQAELQLETWKVYGQMAEQSAICANFSKLMESQSILNPDLGLYGRKGENLQELLSGKLYLWN